MISRITKRHLENCLPYIVLILMVISILFFQMTHHFFINGIDSFFHMSVTYDTYRQLKAGNFSYFLSAFGFYHSLRIVNAVYGPLGGYFSGLLLLITGSWFRWEIAMFFIIFMISGVSMYQLCRYWHVTRIYSTLIGCLYIFTFPIMAFWMNSQYDGVGAAFMPWILYFGSKILNHNDFKNWKLVLLLVILAEIHVFSLLLGLLVLGLCYIVSLIINDHRSALTWKAIKVLFMTTILSFNVWGGIIEVIGSNHSKIIPTYSVPNFFQNMWSTVFYNHQFSIHQNLFLLGLSATVLLLITLFLYLLDMRYLNVQLNFIMIILGIGFLVLSSRLIPWPLIQQHLPILDTDLQFPKRFLPVALSAFCLMLGVLLTKLQHHAHNQYFLTFILFVILGMFVIHAWQNTQYEAQFLYRQQTVASYFGSAFHTATADGWLTKGKKPQPKKLKQSLRGGNPGRYFQLVTKTTPDYMPTTQRIKTDAQYHKINAYNRYYKQVILNKLSYHHHLAHHVMTISFNRKSSRRIIVPFVKYAHTQVMMNGKLLSHYRLTQVGVINVKPRTGHNVMKFKYIPSTSYRVMTWISIVVWLMFLVNIGLEIVKKHLW